MRSYRRNCTEKRVQYVKFDGFVKSHKSRICHFDRREKSDLPRQVILSRAKDLSVLDRSLSLFGTMLRIGFLALLEMTCK